MNSAGADNKIEDPKMPLTEHLRELRRRMIYTFIGLGLAFGVTWTFSFEILEFIKNPLLAHLPDDLAGGGGKKLYYDTLTAPFFTHLKAAFYSAVFLTLPFTIFQIWRFVAPGPLHPVAQRRPVAAEVPRDLPRRKVQLGAVDARAGLRVVLRKRVAIDPRLHRRYTHVGQQQEDRYRHDEERRRDPAEYQHPVSILAP